METADGGLKAWTLHYSEKDIPVMSWGSVVDLQERSIKTYTGAWVEVFENGVIEGCHSGAQIIEDVLDSEFCLATGFIHRDHKTTFFTASHTLDPLYYIQHHHHIYISNSLPFVLAMSGRTLKDDYPYYAADFSYIQNHVEKAPLDQGHLNIAYNINLVVHNNDLKTEKKKSCKSFGDFQSYAETLEIVLEKTAKNAVLSDRKQQFTPITTISSGYDSVCVTALGKKVLGGDLKEALTIRDAGKNLGDDNDSGVQNAEYLGLDSYEIGRFDYKTDQKNELLFSVIGAPQDISLGILRERLQGTFLLRGDHGDSAWSYNVAPGGFRRIDPAGVNCNEFRHHVGFINVPLAFLGIEHHADLIRIAKSAEMAPWRLNNAYDRPVARKIGEDMGVSRASFGQQKKATAVSDFDTAYFSDDLADILQQRWKRYKNEHKAQIVIGTLLHKAFHLQSFAINKMNSLIRRLGYKNFNFKRRFISRRYVRPISQWSFLGQWSTQEIIKEFYKDI
ncbi:MAG: hypothetical protein ACRBDL_11510 [Alphaproteobacteria bacterium]